MNERSFYKRDCDKCGKNVVSMFPAGSHKKVYCSPCWWSDDWGAEEYGKDYDFSKPFFSQFAELYAEVPELARIVSESTLVRSDYSNIATNLKDCYLVFNSDYNADCMYSTYLERSKNSSDLYMADLCEKCYDGRNLFKDFNVLFSDDCNECVDVFFSKNCIGCSNCFGCVNLRGKSYYIFNEAYTKEEYDKKMSGFDIGSFRFVEEAKAKVRELSLSRPHKYAEGLNNSNASGDYVFNSKDTFYSYEVGYCQDCKYCHFLFVFPTKDSYDFTMWGGNSERTYECMGTGGGQRNVKFCFNSWSQADGLEYCWYINNAKNSNLFGCIGLRNKEYCVLNKRYTKEEYEKLVPKIIEQMNSVPYIDAKDRTYKYGEFFPPELSPFAYNETVAQQYLPLAKDMAESLGYKWKEAGQRNYQITLDAQQLPDNIKDIKDEIINQVIGCSHAGKCDEQCTEAFKVTQGELEFYRQMNVPLPRLCPNCRYYRKVKEKNPIKFWHGKCQCAGSKSENGVYANQAAHFHGGGRCLNEFETSYSPERPEIVYCEQCYNSEVA